MMMQNLSPEVSTLMDRHYDNVCVAALNIENGTSTQADNLLWLVNLSEIWVLDTQEELAEGC
jgi:hypothetical protein